jgi:hypothetical protein
VRQALVSRAWLRVPDVWVPRVERKKGERALPVHMILLVTNDNVYHTHCSVHYPRTRQASSSNQSRSLSVSVSAARESSDLRKQKTRAEQPLRCLEQAPQVLAKRPVVAASPPAKFSRVFYSADGDFCCVEMIDPEAQAVLRGQNLPHLEKRRRALDCEDAGPFQGHARWQQCLLSLSLQILEKRFPGGSGDVRSMPAVCGKSHEWDLRKRRLLTFPAKLMAPSGQNSTSSTRHPVSSQPTSDRSALARSETCLVLHTLRGTQRHRRSAINIFFSLYYRTRSL